MLGAHGPVAMGGLLEEFRLYAGPVDELIILQHSDEMAARRYAKIFELIGHHLSPVFGSGGRALALAILTREWMLGYPVSRLVSTRISRERRKPKPAATDSLIRRTLEDIGEIARFQAPRYLACYSDVLSIFLDEVDRDDLVSQNVDVNAHARIWRAWRDTACANGTGTITYGREYTCGGTSKKRRSGRS